MNTVYIEFAQHLEDTFEIEGGMLEENPVTLDELKDIFHKGLSINQNLSLEEQAAAWRKMFRTLQLGMPESPHWKSQGINGAQAIEAMIIELIRFKRLHENRIIIPPNNKA